MDLSGDALDGRAALAPPGRMTVPVPLEVARPGLPVNPSGRRGACYDIARGGTNFALYTGRNARSVVLEMYDPASPGEPPRLLRRVRLNRPSPGHLWSGFVDGVRPGQAYGFRVDGPWNPRSGQWYNADKLLTDPYSPAFVRDFVWDDNVPAVLPFERGHGSNTFIRSQLDSAAYVPLSVVADGDPNAFDWGDHLRPNAAPADRHLVEVHVGDWTRRMPGVPRELRGTYAGLAHPESVRRLKELHFTHVELMPIHASVNGEHWNYSTFGMFAPNPRFAASRDPLAQIAEFQQMVKTLHEAGIQVILDVVYNHTAEGSHEGPMLSFRGLANDSYYQLSPTDRRYYYDKTGCGNTFNVAGNPEALKVVLDSLRYWVTVMKVDGFRFDLATAMGRVQDNVDLAGPFFAAVHADPVLSGVEMLPSNRGDGRQSPPLLIAEPWDIGAYNVGQYPEGWAEWNDRYQEDVRNWWLWDRLPVPEFVRRISGSDDKFRDHGLLAGIHYARTHDGYTLRDVVSYVEKHNESNGEQNRDGTHEDSNNFGFEGPSTEARTIALRRRMVRNLLLTDVLALGPLMTSADDVIAQTHNGNNNAYKGPDDLTAIDWEKGDDKLYAFLCRINALRASEPVYRRDNFLVGRLGEGAHEVDCLWLTASGTEIQGAQQWNDPGLRSIGRLLNGQATGRVDLDGNPITGNTMLDVFHPGAEDVEWTLPTDWGNWEMVIDTHRPTGEPAPVRAERIYHGGETVKIHARSTVVFRASAVRATSTSNPA